MCTNIFICINAQSPSGGSAGLVAWLWFWGESPLPSSAPANGCACLLLQSDHSSTLKEQTGEHYLLFTEKVFASCGQNEKFKIFFLFLFLCIMFFKRKYHIYIYTPFLSVLAATEVNFVLKRFINIALFTSPFVNQDKFKIALPLYTQCLKLHTRI